MIDLKKKDVVYYARIVPSVGEYDICELVIRTIEDDYFVGVDKDDKHAYLFNNNYYGEIVFKDRKEALKVINKAIKNKAKIISNETYYEEY